MIFRHFISENKVRISGIGGRIDGWVAGAGEMSHVKRIALRSGRLLSVTVTLGCDGQSTLGKRTATGASRGRGAERFSTIKAVNPRILRNISQSEGIQIGR